MKQRAVDLAVFRSTVIAWWSLILQRTTFLSGEIRIEQAYKRYYTSTVSFSVWICMHTPQQPTCMHNCTQKASPHAVVHLHKSSHCLFLQVVASALWPQNPVPTSDQCLYHLQSFIHMLFCSHLIIERHDTLARFVNHKSLQHKLRFEHDTLSVGNVQHLLVKVNTGTILSLTFKLHRITSDLVTALDATCAHMHKSTKITWRPLSMPNTLPLMPKLFLRKSF